MYIIGKRLCSNCAQEYEWDYYMQHLSEKVAFILVDHNKAHVYCFNPSEWPKFNFKATCPLCHQPDLFSYDDSKE